MDIVSQRVAVGFLQQRLSVLVVASACTIRRLHICAIITQLIEPSFLLVKSHHLGFASEFLCAHPPIGSPYDIDLNRLK